MKRVTTKQKIIAETTPPAKHEKDMLLDYQMYMQTTKKVLTVTIKASLKRHWI